MKVRISDITLADDVNIRQDLRPDVVERYAEILDDLPPIELWRTNGTLLLSDGWHRLAAARQKGRTEISADVHEGDRTEAMVAAIVSNTRHGLPLSTAERDAGVVRLERAGWKKRRIARELGLSEVHVRRIIDAAPVPAHLPHRGEVVRAPREYRIPLAEAADVGGWTQAETRAIARDLADPNVPVEDKRRAIEKMNARTPDGRLGLPAPVVGAVLREARDRAAGPAIYAFFEASREVLRRLALDSEPLAGLDQDDLRALRVDLERAEEATERIREIVEEATR